MLESTSDLFERASVAVLGERLLRLLAGAVAAPDRAIGRLDVLSSAERATIVSVWNDTARAVPTTTLPALFAAQAQRTPAATAVVFEDRRLSYAELDAHANQLAHHLRGQGIGPETVVGLLVERWPEMLIGLIGILKAGAAYLPLDPGYPAERLAFMLRDAFCGALVTQAALPGRLDLPTTGPLIRLDADWAEVARQPTSRTATALEGGHAAYVIYTSGSTGTPKGVVVTHAGIPNLVAAQIDGFMLSPGARVLQFASPSFDAAIAEIAVALLSGATLVLPAERDDALSNLIIEQRVTHATLPPALLSTLSEDIPLQNLIVAGEACPPDVAARWSKGRRMVNAYGPTETTVCATISEALSGDAIPLPALFEAQAERTPDAIAVVFEGATELRRTQRAGQPAGAGCMRGVRPDARVAICVERSLEMVVALLAILKAGGAYVPLDPTYPAERLAYMLEDAAAPWCSPSARLRDAAAGATARGAGVTRGGRRRRSRDARRPTAATLAARRPRLRHLHLRLHRPAQGRVNAHRGIVNRLLWMQEEYGLSAADRCCRRRRSASTCRCGSSSGRC